MKLFTTQDVAAILLEQSPTGKANFESDLYAQNLVENTSIISR